MRKNRILELDLLRGSAILCMIAVHFIFDLQYFGGVILDLPAWFQMISLYGHLIFILLSGICVTLGSRPFQRGLTVFACGLGVSYATLFGELILGISNIRIWFGILHLLGISMMVYPLLQKLPPMGLVLIGSLILFTGMWMQRISTPLPYLFPIGIRCKKVFSGSDYFPVFPYLGWFLLGAAAGKILYHDRRSFFPAISETGAGGFLCTVGRNALVIYLLHQPILLLIIHWIL